MPDSKLRAARAAELAAINVSDAAAARRLVASRLAAENHGHVGIINKAADQYPAPFNYAGNAQDISAAPWANFGATTPTVTGGQSDPLGGANAFQLTDDDATTLERRILSFNSTVVGKKRASIYHKMVAGGIPVSGGFTMIRRTSDAFVWGAAETTWSIDGIPTTTWAGTGPGRVAEQFIINGWWLMTLYMDADVDTQNLLWHLAGTRNVAAETGSQLYFQPKFWDA